MKKMNRTVLLAAAAGFLAMASFSCRTPDEHGDHPQGDSEHPDSDHPTEHEAEHPEGDK
ncbi:MAG: hypothetical protein ACI8QS_001338 [Planctomycetota bacterium]|jgi:hypothetical protein